jgi:hypothetical protein
MTIILSDHNCKKHSQQIFYTLKRRQYLDWLNIDLIFFEDIGLHKNASDEEVWRLCQKNGYYLLTGNRSRKDEAASLHDILDTLADEHSRPVITIGNLNRVIHDKEYCEACARAIAEIVFNEVLYIGVPRLYIP